MSIMDIYVYMVYYTVLAVDMSSSTFRSSLSSSLLMLLLPCYYHIIYIITKFRTVLKKIVPNMSECNFNLHQHFASVIILHGLSIYIYGVAINIYSSSIHRDIMVQGLLNIH